VKKEYKGNMNNFQGNEISKSNKVKIIKIKEIHVEVLKEDLMCIMGIIVKLNLIYKKIQMAQ
jgi:hypothetical protein